MALSEAAKALFGLQVRVITPKTGSWSTTDALPVFYDPVGDEKDTKYYKGYNPDGTVVQFPFDSEDIPYPIYYLESDERFFHKPENQISPPTSWTPIEDDKWSRLANFISVPRAYANHPSGHTSCYDEKEIEGLSLWFSDDHEPITDQNGAEMYSKVG